MSTFPPDRTDSPAGEGAKFTLQSVRVATGTDEEGMLVFLDGRLVAVLVRLSEAHEGLAGDWFLETGYGPLSGPDHATFAVLQAAPDWIEQSLADATRRRSGSHDP